LLKHVSNLSYRILQGFQSLTAYLPSEACTVELFEISSRISKSTKITVTRLKRFVYSLVLACLFGRIYSSRIWYPHDKTLNNTFWNVYTNDLDKRGSSNLFSIILRTTEVSEVWVSRRSMAWAKFNYWCFIQKNSL
jgi:hypothetical protein